MAYTRVGTGWDATADAYVRGRERAEAAKAARLPSDRRMLASFYRPWYLRPFTWLLMAVPLLVAGRIALTPLATTRARAALATATAHDVQFRDLKIFTWPPVLALDDVVVRSRTNGAELMRAERVEVHMALSELWRRERHVRLRVRAPQVTAAALAGPALSLTDVQQVLPRAQVEVLAIDDGRVALPAARDINGGFLTHVNATVTGIPAAAATLDRPLKVDGSARFLDSGEVAGQMTFTGTSDADTKLTVRSLTLADLERLGGLASAAGESSHGALDITAQWQVRGGAISGQVESALTSATLVTDANRLNGAVDSALAGVSPDVQISRRVVADPSGATVDVLSGSLSPEAGRTTAALGLIRAAIVQGAARGLDVLAAHQAQEAAAAAPQDDAMSTISEAPAAPAQPAVVPLSVDSTPAASEAQP